eukprot:Nitzschia sp. Nitz4//scaffold178_size73299//16664//18722//NITZ4_005696-RA/size73299-snap-gene-0.131-mRNA-1//1//CDS//3329539113//7527//frame0
MGSRKGRSKSPAQKDASNRSLVRKDARKETPTKQTPTKQLNKKTSTPKSSSKKQPKPEPPKEVPEVETSSEEEEEEQVVEQESTEDDNDNSEASDDEEEEEQATRKPKVFSDENAKWLKPKKDKLLSSDEEDEEEDDEHMGSDDESDEEEMEVEREARLLDAHKQLEEEEAEDELRETVAKHTAIYHLPTQEELDGDVDRVVPPSELRSHIDSIIEVLADFKERREPNRARTEYIERLGGFIAELFGYLPELVEYFLTMFSPAEALEFIEFSDKQRPLVIRTNTLKTRRKDLALALMKRGVTLDPLAAWSKVGLKITESPVPIGATPEYLSGHYMLQSAASMCPVLALSPEPKERVLDMSAAPGGKTSYLSQLMRNTGIIFANDLRPDRQKATVANMHRLGVKNVVTCTHDGRKMPKLFRHYRFDRVLLDAPCSGLGVISRDPSCKVQRTMLDVQKTAHLQKELLLAAIDMLNPKSKTGGVMVYSTCSVSVAENEEVVNYALSKRDIRIIETGLDFGRPGFTRYQQKRFHPSLAKTRRFYPHVHNMDGFYVCKIQKLSDKILTEDENAPAEETEAAEVEETTTTPMEKKNKGNGKKAKGKKGKKRSAENGKEESEPKKKPKNDKVSIPPTKPKPKKAKKTSQSAKMTKPRRLKPEKMM